MDIDIQFYFHKQWSDEHSRIISTVHASLPVDASYGLVYTLTDAMDHVTSYMYIAEYSFGYVCVIPSSEIGLRPSNFVAHALYHVIV